MAESTAHSREVLVAYLRQNLGNEKATAVIDDACAAVGVGWSLTREQCLAVLEHVAMQPGLIGITARFAKSRAILSITA
jgi:hypothetical protein